MGEGKVIGREDVALPLDHELDGTIRTRHVLQPQRRRRLHAAPATSALMRREGRREGRRSDGGRKRGMEGGMKGRREEGREVGREGGREGGGAGSGPCQCRRSGCCG